jgi:hypothetical protein
VQSEIGVWECAFYQLFSRETSARAADLCVRVSSSSSSAAAAAAACCSPAYHVSVLPRVASYGDLYTFPLCHTLASLPLKRQPARNKISTPGARAFVRRCDLDAIIIVYIIWIAMAAVVRAQSF